MKINMQAKVREVLIKTPRCRDDDTYLIYEIWKNEMQSDINKISLLETLSLWKNKKISHPSAIMRARRKVQEIDRNTRGNLWEKRHEEQKNVKKDLGY
jgi:hypothetical protein